MVEFFSFAGELGNIVHDLLHRNDWETSIDTKSLDNFVLERIGGSKEHNFRILWPSLQKLFALIFND